MRKAITFIITARTMDEILNSKKAGDTLLILFSRRNAIREIEVDLGKKMERSFRIKPLANPNPLQAEILNGWLKN